MQHAQSNPTAAFFQSNFSLSLSVFDARRGQREAEEYEKVLAFFPNTAPLATRSSIIGLAQALGSFVANISEESSPFRTMDAHMNRWVMFECEPHIWILAVVKKAWATSACTDAACKTLLQSIHSAFVLLHGKITLLLDQDPSAFCVRRVLQPLLAEVGSHLLRPETKQLQALANPLAGHDWEAVPLLPVSQQAFLAVQSLVNQLVVTSFYGNRLVLGALALWGGHPLWGTLGAHDTAALTMLAERALVPAAKMAQQQLQGRRLAANADVNSETLLSPHQWRLGAQQTGPPSSSSSSAPPAAAASLGPGSGAAAGAALPSAAAGALSAPGGAAGPTGAPATPPYLANFLCPKLRMLPRAAAAPVLVPVAAGQGANGHECQLPMAHVWLQDTGEWALLLPYQRGQLMVLALLHDTGGGAAQQPLPPEVLAALAAVLGRGAGPALALLGAEVPRRNLWHVKGHRYCYVDGLCHAARATPLRKVHTLSPASLQQLARLRNKTDDWRTAAGCQQAGSRGPSGSGGSSGGSSADEQQEEVVVRTGLDAWLVLRSAPGGRRLYCATEVVPEQGLAAVGQRVDALCDQLFPGVFMQM